MDIFLVKMHGEIRTNVRIFERRTEPPIVTKVNCLQKRLILNNAWVSEKDVSE